MEEESTSKRRCPKSPCCNSKKNDTEEEIRESFCEKRFSGDPQQETFCNAVFLPEFVREFIKEQGEKFDGQEREPMVKKKFDDQEKKPMVKKTQGIILTFEIPALAEVVYYYSINIDSSTEDISYLLNQHVSNIIQCVMAAGGDVIVLEAGYIQCLWLASLDQIDNLAPKILNAALYIQRRYGNVETRFGIYLRNRIGISCGDIECFFVGDKRVHYVLVGNAAKDSFYAASQCGSYEVIVSREFWKAIIQKEDYKYQTLPDEYVTIYSVEKNGSESANSEAIEILSSSLKGSSFEGSSSDISLETYEQRYGKEMLNYIHPFHRDAKTTQQIQFLCSVSDVVCVTILVRKLDMSTPDHLHDTIESISYIAQKHKGVVKTILYNPSIIVSVYFGYPGFKRSNDAVKSVEFSQEVFKILKKAGLQVNIGISTGLVFCGLIGPPNRMECCLIGMPVRIAYKLSKACKENAILCGLNTYFLTRRFVGEIFDPVKEKIQIGDQINPEIHFEVSEEPKKSVPEVKSIGRDDEKEAITKALIKLKDKVFELEDKLVPLFLIVGKMGMGKSTLLKWIMANAQDIGFDLSPHVENHSFEESLENAWQIIQEILKKSGNDSREKILNLIDKKQNEFPLHKLNSKLNTEFQPVMALYGEEDVRRLLVTLVIKASKSRPILIGIDNLEHVGTETWLFLQELLLIRAAIVVATVTEEYNPSVPFVRSLMMQQFSSITMRPLNEEELGLLSCVVLNVKAINREFLPFFEKYSEGNALRLEEILMIPPLQNHFAIIKSSCVSQTILATKFLFNKDVSSKVVCDIVNTDEMEKLQIPAHLLDVVRDHTTGLSAEEQMLIRKCALLGDDFGLFVLEAVCPEYPTAELRYKLRILLKKNLLRLHCQHLGIIEKRDRETIALREFPMEFCQHPIRFYCDYLRKSVLNVMPESQRQRLNLYLADLLMNRPGCDACKNERQRRNSSLPPVSRHFHIPCVDMRMCHCLPLKTHFALQVEYHLEKGNGLIGDRIDMLIEAAEFGVLFRSPKLVDKILIKAKRLLAELEVYNKIETNPAAVAVVRLKAQVNLLYGKNNEAMREIKQALLMLNVLFPSDMEKNINRHKWTDHPLAPEFLKCLEVGCFVLKVLGMYDVAKKAGKYHLKLLSKHGRSYVNVVRSKGLLLSVIWKTKPGISRERQTTRLGNEIRTLCFKRLMEYPVVEQVELKVIISAFKAVLNMLFEKGELEAAAELGKKVFQLLVLIKHEKELTRILSVLARVYFFQHNYDKCFEMLDQMADAFQQSVDPVAEAIYFSHLILALRFTNYRGIWQDKIDICSEYASKTPPLPTHPKFKNRVFCLCAKMCLWSNEHNLLDAAAIWSNRATNLLQTVRMDNYWTLMGSLCLVSSDIERIQRNFVVYTAQELSQIKRNLTKDVEVLKKSINNYVPVLNIGAEQIEKNFQVVIERCKILKL